MVMLEHKNLRNFSIEEFLSIEDKELQRFIWGNHGINVRTKKIRVDNEKKLGFYMVEQRINKNQAGVFYCKSRLLLWIVYNKETRKCTTNALNTGDLFRDFMDYHFRYPEVMMKFIVKPTATLCKRIVEGKIRTLRDLMNYHGSFTLRNKKLFPETIFKYIMNGNFQLLTIFEDPNSIPSDVSVPEHIIRTGRKIKDMETLNSDYEQWYKEQSEKYDRQFGSRDAEVRVATF